jgi:phosphatidate phosphatase PAH1
MLKTQRDNTLKKNHDENIKIKEVKTNDGVIVQKRKKRIQLSKNSIKNMNLMNGQRTIKFD